MSPDMATRYRAALAALADYRASAGKDPATRAPRADRLADEMSRLLGAFAVEEMAMPEPAKCERCGAEIVPVDVTIGLWRHVGRRDLATDFLNEDHDAKPRGTS